MKLKIFYAFLFLVVLFLVACGNGTGTEPTQTVMTEPTQTIVTADSLSLNCTDKDNKDIFLHEGSYTATANPWNKDSQGRICVGIGASEGESVVARWTWDFSDSGVGVKAYPEIIFGQKPWAERSTTENLPKPINTLISASASMTFEVTPLNSFVGNTAFDMWLTSDVNRNSSGALPITHEVMVWLENYDMASGSDKRISVDGSDYWVYFEEKTEQRPWHYIALVKVPLSDEKAPASNEKVDLDLKAILLYLVNEDSITSDAGKISGSEYLASVEFGNEVLSGAGETKVHSFAVSVQ